MARSAEIGSKGSRFIVLASVCIVVAALYFAQEVLIPLALSVLFCFLLSPLVTRLERWRLGRVPAVITVVSAVGALAVLLGWVVTSQVLSLADRLPEYQGEIVQKVEKLRARFVHRGGVTDKLADVAQKVQEATTRPATSQSTQPASQPGEPAQAGTTVAPPEPTIVQPGESGVGAVSRELVKGAPPTGPPPGTAQSNPLWVVALPAPASPVRTLGSYLGVLLSPLGTAGLVLVFVVFILLQREDLRDRLIRLIGHGDLNVTTTALDDAGSRISRYLMAQAIVNGTYGIAVALGLWLIGYFVGDKPFPSFVLWGLLCGILRFIPYIGPWVASAFPIALSLAVYSGFHPFLWTAGMFVGIELLSNNLMEPYLYGTSTGMSTIAILVSAVFWTWLWGAVGLLLATPLTVVLVVIGKYVPQMGFLDIMLGDEPVLEPGERVYQRLLASDQEEATELAREYLMEMGLERIYDEVLNPALSLAEQDRHRGRLDDRRQSYVRQAMRDMIEELGDEWRLRQERTDAEAMKEAAAMTVEAAKGTPALTSGAAVPERTKDVHAAPAVIASGNGKGGNGSANGTSAGSVAEAAPERRPATHVPKDCTVNVAILPAHDEADEISGLMLAQVLEFRGYCSFPMSVTKLASEMVEAVESKQAHVVVVSAMPPAAVAHSRYLCKRLHARFPDLNMVVGLWTMKGDLRKAKERVTCAGTVQVSSRLVEAVEQIGQLAQPVIVAAGQGAGEPAGA